MRKIPPGFHGKKGRSGRKGVGQERASYALLEKLFMGQVDQEEIEKAIRSGIFSVKDRFLLTAMEGDPKILSALFNKLFPDKMEMMGKDGEPIKVESTINTALDKAYGESDSSGEVG
jgi:hypothetical protein